MQRKYWYIREYNEEKCLSVGVSYDLENGQFDCKREGQDQQKNLEKTEGAEQASLSFPKEKYLFKNMCLAVITTISCCLKTIEIEDNWVFSLINIDSAGTDYIFNIELSERL